VLFIGVAWIYCALYANSLTPKSSECPMHWGLGVLRSIFLYGGGLPLRLSIECSHKQLQLFRISLDARTILVLLIIWIIWGLFRILKIF
jgi:hypothetical protein